MDHNCQDSKLIPFLNNENEIDKSTSAYNSQYEDKNNEENEEYTGPVMSGM